LYFIQILSIEVILKNKLVLKLTRKNKPFIYIFLKLGYIVTFRVF